MAKRSIKKFVKRIRDVFVKKTVGKRNTNPTANIAVRPNPPAIVVTIPDYIKWPAPKAVSTTYSQILDGDFVDISKPIISNTGLQDFELSHIASLRPEIIAATELYPIYPDDATSGENLTSVGKLVTFQYQSQNLKAAILRELVKSITETSATPEDILGSFDDRYKLVNAAQKELALVGATQNDLRKILDFRRNLQGVISIPHGNMIGDQSKFGLVQKSIPSTMSVNQLLLKLTGYNESQLNSFSNTKIFMTLCSDLEQALSNGVFGNLVYDVDQDRISDLNPIKIDLTHANTLIDVDTLNAPFGQAGQVLMTDVAKFDRFQTTLPRDPYTRLMYTINFITKELHNSKYLFNLGKQTRTSINGNFYNDLFGRPGSDIFSQVSGDKSLVTIASLRDLQRNATVLPFEDVYIENNTGNSQLSNRYIPGKRYFIDSILDGIVTNSPDLNTKPIVDYANRTQAIFNDISSVLKDISDLRNSYFLYSSSKVYKYLLSQIDSSTAGLTKSNKVVKEQAIAFALLRKACEDSTLKLMLFQYMIYLGIYLRKNNQSQNQYIIFDTIADELGSSEKLNYLHAPNLINTTIDPQTSFLTPISLSNISYAQTSTMAQHLRVFARNIARYVTRNQILNRRGASPLANQLVVEASQEAISEFLLSPVKSSSFVAKGTIFYDFFDFIQAVDKITESGFFAEANGTKFRSVKATNLVYMIYEMYTSAAKIFGFTNFSMSRITEFTFISNRVRSSILVDWYKHAIAREKIQLLIGKNNGITETKQSFIKRKTQFNIDKLQIIGSGNALSLGSNVEFDYVALRDRPRSQNNSTGVMTDIFLLFGDQIDLNAQMLPKQGSKIYEIYQKLWDEDWLYPTMIDGFISLLNNNIAKTIKAKTQLFSNPKNLLTIRGTKLRPEIENLRVFDQAITEYAQIRGNFDDNPTKEDVVQFFEQLSPSPLKLQMLLTMFKDSSFLPVGSANETRKRVLTIGVPNGMVDSLNQTKLLSSINNNTTGRTFFTTQKGIESDIIKVNIYRRDLRFDNLIFKPKSYYFDASLFMNETVWNKLSAELNANSVANPNSFTFDEIVNKATFYNYENGSAFFPREVKSIDAKYLIDPYKGNKTVEYYGTNLPRNIRFEILRNTFQSYLLQYYITLTTGMILDEKTFTSANEKTDVNSISLGTKFIEEVFTYLRGTGEPLLNNNIQEALSNPNVSKQAKLLLEFISSVALTIDPGVIYTRLANNPLSFDRVFNIVETADAYEIDIEKTKLTKDGLKLLNSDKFNESLIRFGNSYYLPFTGMDDVSISDYFVDIEAAEFV